MATELKAAADLLRRGAIAFVRRYHQHALLVDASLPSTPALIVSNHGFGGGHDLNVFALLRTMDDLGVADQVTYLTHQLTWTVGLGPLARALGCQPAGRQAAEAAFAEGRHVAVFPGGDIDAGKAWWDRNRIIFGGRSGYARLAIDNNVPIVPVVTAGAGNSLFVVTDGQRLAQALQLPRLLRLKTLPVTLSIPWGLTVGVTVLVPYVPLPVKISTAVLPAMNAVDGETPESFAARVEHAMQARLDELVAKH